MSAGIIRAAKLSAVYGALTGKMPHPAGQDKWRAPAPWRDGENASVAIDDAKGVWFDHVANEGGGIVDLVVRIKGGSPRDAMQWLSEHTGHALTTTPPAQRAEWHRDQAALNRDLPDATLWRQSAVAMGNEVLDQMKAALSNANAPQPAPGEIAELTQRVAGWRKLSDEGLVAEFRNWQARDPETTDAMARAARQENARVARDLAREVGLSKTVTAAEGWRHGHDYPEVNTPERPLWWLLKQRDLDAIVEDALERAAARTPARESASRPVALERKPRRVGRSMGHGR